MDTVISTIFLVLLFNSSLLFESVDPRELEWEKFNKKISKFGELQKSGNYLAIEKSPEIIEVDRATAELSNYVGVTIMVSCMILQDSHVCDSFYI